MMPSGFIGISQSATERLKASMSHYTRDKGARKGGISDGNSDRVVSMTAGIRSFCLCGS